MFWVEILVGLLVGYTLGTLVTAALAVGKHSEKAWERSSRELEQPWRG